MMRFKVVGLFYLIFLWIIQINRLLLLMIFGRYSGDIDVKQIRSCDNLADMLTKPLPTATFKKMVHNIGMHQLKDIFTMNNGNSMYS